MNNEVPEYQIHSTDTHGYTEQIFAATHLIGVDFAPRIKKVGDQKIYSFSAKRTYQKKGYKILPSRTINKKLILKHWDEILRFMATIKLNKVTASQLFSRFNSYSSSNSLYKAFKEFGRIIKSKFILTYYDDVQLRQQIQKQLNRVELSNKFAHAVFFDNDQAFQDGEQDEQEISTACQVLIQNCIILWNYLYLSNLIISTTDKEMRTDLIEAINQGSVITWQHVNLRGEYDFRKRAANDSKFDMQKIRNLKI
jgi:TnpA family transposase